MAPGRLSVLGTIAGPIDWNLDDLGDDLRAVLGDFAVVAVLVFALWFVLMGCLAVIATRIVRRWRRRHPDP